MKDDCMRTGAVGFCAVRGRSTPPLLGINVGLPLHNPEAQGAQGVTHQQDEQLVRKQQIVGVEEGHSCCHCLNKLEDGKCWSAVIRVDEP